MAFRTNPLAVGARVRATFIPRSAKPRDRGTVVEVRETAGTGMVKVRLDQPLTVGEPYLEAADWQWAELRDQTAPSRAGGR